MDAEKIKIVIVDSGVNSDCFRINKNLVQGYSFVNNHLENKISDFYGHGTAVFGIISSVIDFAEIINIRVPSVDKCIDITQLVNVLTYVADNIKCDILNLSLGVEMCSDVTPLKTVCDKLSNKGVIIVAAHNNRGILAYPAAFNNVIGVITGHSCKRKNDFEYIEDDAVNIAAMGGIQKVSWMEHQNIIIGGNSFACAHVTVQVARFFREGAKTRNDILNRFREIAISKHTIRNETANKRIPFTIKKAALFPFNKEMHNLLRFFDQLDYDIVGVFETKYSAKVGLNTAEILSGADVLNLKIQNIEDINWDEFDTLILGHTQELRELIHKDVRKDIIEECIKRKKNLFCFDDLAMFGYSRNDKIYYPKIDMTNVSQSRFGLLYHATKPVLGVFGTSSQQGKFTLQLTLRKLFKQRGYDVGQIGTEPNSQLFGMDYVFPMGYNSSVYISGLDTVRYLNAQINNLCLQNKDIIIAGSQSGTVPFDFVNERLFTFPQMDFLMGVQPDAVLLCINPYDDLYYVNRTINFIESSVDCKVLALIVFPMDISSGWKGSFGGKRQLTNEKYKQIKSKLVSEFEKPVFRLGCEEDMRSLVDEVIGYFC